MMGSGPRRWAERLLRRTPSAPPRDARAEADDARLVAGIRAGDEAVFAELLDRLGPVMLRLALVHVRRPAVAEDVVQDTWVAVLRGIDGFEGRRRCGRGSSASWSTGPGRPRPASGGAWRRKR